MTGSEWRQWWDNMPWTGIGKETKWLDLIADLAACEKERDTIARNMQGEIDKLFSRAEKAEARVKELREAMEACQPEGQCYCDGCQRIRIMQNALRKEE